MTEPDTLVEDISRKFTTLRDKCSEFIVGNKPLIDALCIGVLSEGNILIEGIPGTAKTSAIKVMAHLLGCDTKRVQCSVDMQPSDIIGVRIWNSETKDFELKKGPVFTNILIVDEINRLPPKSQSAFIESMSEKQVTIDRNTFQLQRPFMAVATQNPFEHEGVYPLIEAQKDRFMISVKSEFLDKEGEIEIIKREDSGSLDIDRFLNSTEPIFTQDYVIQAQTGVKNIIVSDPVQNYISELVISSREHADVNLGISSRGTISLLKGSKALAALNGRDYVIPDDVKTLAKLVFPHRLILNYEAEISGSNPENVIKQILDTVEVP
jgi:MoxR-like ATPase